VFWASRSSIADGFDVAGYVVTSLRSTKRLIYLALGCSFRQATLLRCPGLISKLRVSVMSHVPAGISIHDGIFPLKTLCMQTSAKRVHVYEKSSEDVVMIYGVRERKRFVGMIKPERHRWKARWTMHTLERVRTPREATTKN
jgi:hypothetical protein